jgi:hypothetical protein
MSVLVSKRNKSRLNVLVNADTIHDQLIELMQRNFGIRNMEHFVRVQYAYGKIESEDFSKYSFLMNSAKKRLEQNTSILANNLRTAKSIYPTNMTEYEERRKYQDLAIGNCRILLRELQRIADIFDVNLNIYAECVKSINSEIKMITAWRQKDNRFKSYLKG